MPTPSNYQVLSHIIRNPSSPKNGVRILEAYLTIAWCDARTPEPVAVSYAAIRNHTNLTVNTVRTGIDELNTSGRWAITKHTGSTASTYLPLFLSEIGAASEETLAPEQPAGVPTPPMQPPMQPPVQPTAAEPAALLIPEPSPAYEAPEPVVAQEPVDAGIAAEYTDYEPWNTGYPDDYFDEPDYPDPAYFADPEEAEDAIEADTPVSAPQPVVIEAPVVIASPAVHEESVVAAPPAAPAYTWVAATTPDFITAKSKKYDALEGMKSEDAAELLSALEIILNGREVPKRYEERFLGTMRGKRVVSPDQPFEDFVKAASPSIEQFLSMVL